MQKQVNVVGNLLALVLHPSKDKLVQKNFALPSMLLPQRALLRQQTLAGMVMSLPGHTLQRQGDTDLLSFLLILTSSVTWKSSYFFIWILSWCAGFSIQRPFVSWEQVSPCKFEYLYFAFAWSTLAMYSMFLSFPTGHTPAAVTQFPSHRLIGKEQTVTLKCDPISGHEILL